MSVIACKYHGIFTNSLLHETRQWYFQAQFYVIQLGSRCAKSNHAANLLLIFCSSPHNWAIMPTTPSSAKQIQSVYLSRTKFELWSEASKKPLRKEIIPGGRGFSYVRVCSHTGSPEQYWANSSMTAASLLSFAAYLLGLAVGNPIHLTHRAWDIHSSCNPWFQRPS